MRPESASHLQLVKVTGKDAKTFLQGQLTNDINLLENSWQYSAYCNPKGRAMAVFTIWADEDVIYMLVESALAQTVLKRLRMYVLRSRVTIEEINSNISVKFDLPHENPLYQQTKDDSTYRLGFGNRELMVTPEEAQTYSDFERWLEADISEGLPRVTEETYEAFIPQMINMDILNGINFKKGCYTGQEIIARMKYLGKLKQRSFVCSMLENEEGTGEITAGEKVTDNDGKNIGTIVNASKGLHNVLASLRFENISNGLKTESGVSLQINESQPYDLGLENQ